MIALYPFRFHPILRRYLWGGRRLGSVLHKPIASGNDWAECWEIADLGSDQSIVQFGPLAGMSLKQLVAEHGRDLLGKHHPQPRFPLLLKFLDAAQTLSVQVHPDDACAATLNPPKSGKSEAWVVLESGPESTIYAGLKPGIDREALTAAIRSGRFQDCLHIIRPAPGDCVLLPGGTVHALGKDVLVAEIQQPSDVTYRLFDWNRLDANGRLRPLHIEEGLDATDFTRGPVLPQQPRPTNRRQISRLVECDRFVMDRWDCDSPLSASGDHRCHLLTVLEGVVEVAGDLAGIPLAKGGTILLPASSGETRLTPQGRAVLLDCYLP